MKKFISTFMLLFVLSFAIMGDEGHTHTGGGKSCPQPDQTTCFVADDPETDPVKTVFFEILDYFKSIF